MPRRFLTALMLIAATLFPAAGFSAEGPAVLKLKVDHLACLSCAERFREALAPVCKELALDAQRGEAVCTYEDPVTPKQILKKAKKTGLPTRRIGVARLEGYSISIRP